MNVNEHIAQAQRVGLEEIRRIKARREFEMWAITQVYFGYPDPENSDMFERDGEGYTDACVQAAWMGFNVQSDRRSAATDATKGEES